MFKLLLQAFFFQLFPVFCFCLFFSSASRVKVRLLSLFFLRYFLCYYFFFCSCCLFRCRHGGSWVPGWETISHNYDVREDNLDTSFPFEIENGKIPISLIISAKDGFLLQTHPKQLKNEFVTVVLSKKYIDSVFIIRRGQVIFTTKSTLSAEEILNIKNLLGKRLRPLSKQKPLHSYPC